MSSSTFIYLCYSTIIDHPYALSKFSFFVIIVRLKLQLEKFLTWIELNKSGCWLNDLHRMIQLHAVYWFDAIFTSCQTISTLSKIRRKYTRREFEKFDTELRNSAPNINTSMQKSYVIGVCQLYDITQVFYPLNGKRSYSQIMRTNILKRWGMSYALSNRFDIWRTHWQYNCQEACQIIITVTS